MALRACRKLMEVIATANDEADGENDSDEVEAFSVTDEDKLMAHMMNCVALLTALQKEEQQRDIPASSTDPRKARNKVFMAALSVVGNSLLKIDTNEQPMRTTAAIDQLMKAFPVPTDAYLAVTGSKGWLPLHWAVALFPLQQCNVTEADVKSLYAFDPMAMQSKHVESGGGSLGLTPAHLLCMNPVTPGVMQLIRSLSLCNPLAFSSTTPTTASPLHVVCYCGTPTVALLQHLLQLDRLQTSVRVAFNPGDRVRGHVHCPLGHLCLNLMKRDDELSGAMELVNCLLEVDKSMVVVADAVFACLAGYANAKSENEAVVDRGNSRLLGMIEMLLKANPEAAEYRDSYGRNILHQACQRSLPSKLRIDVMKMMLALHKDAVQERSSSGWLPVHNAASSCDVEVVEFLLGLYPEAASVVTSSGRNLLHVAAGDSDVSRAVPKLQYLCARYPAMTLQGDNGGEMTVHMATSSQRFKTMLALYEAGGTEQFMMPIVHPTNARYGFNGYLHLHIFIFYQSDSLKIASHATSEVADIFRWLLRLYPEAAGIECGVGTLHKKTPYQMAVILRLPDYYRRLLLRAAPTLNPAELHRLNYDERRMAMFLAFRAVTATTEPSLLVRLRGESRDLVQRLVSFL